MPTTSNCADCHKPIDVQPEDIGGVIVCLECMVEREKDLVVGRVTFEVPTINGFPTRPVKVVKKADVQQKADDPLYRHEVAILRLLVPKHSILVREMIELK